MGPKAEYEKITSVRFTWKRGGAPGCGKSKRGERTGCYSGEGQGLGQRWDVVGGGSGSGSDGWTVVARVNEDAKARW